MLSNNWIALIITFTVAITWLRINDFATHRGWISSHLSRKIIHAGTGPFFVLCWLLFNNAPAARYLAALVPFTITLQFAMVGFGLLRDPAAVQAMSRTGDRREILRGPLYYGIVFVILTVVYWKTSPIGIVALMLMCGGDGLAEMFGRPYGRVKLPWNPLKSWVGAIGMFLGGWFFSIVVLAIFIAAGVFPSPLINYIPELTIIALVGAAFESFPLADIDNITVPLSAIVLGHYLF